MQSGNDRGSFVSKLSGTESGLHSTEVTGLGVDQLNRFLVSTSLDATIKLWDFYRRELTKTYRCDFSIENMVYNRLNDLIAFSLSDLTI